MPDPATPATDAMLDNWSVWCSRAPDEQKAAPITYRGVARLLARLRDAEAKRDSITKTGQNMIDHFRARAEKAEAALAEVRREVRSFDATGCDGWHAESVVDTFRQIFERMPEPCEFCGDGPCPHGCGEEAA